jgi:hypothetical protein
MPWRALRASIRGTSQEAPVKQAPILAILGSTALLSACATDPYGRNNVEGRTTAGVLVGGALGALAGRAIGLDPVSGAAVGMVAGGAAGYLIKGPVVGGRQYYKDSRGFCYYVDPSGNPQYDPSVRC